MWGALPDPIILDWDSTVQPKLRVPGRSRDRLQPRQAGPPQFSSAARRRCEDPVVPGLSVPLRRYGERESEARGDGGCRAVARGSPGRAQLG